MGKENPLCPCEVVHITTSAFGHLMWPFVNKLFIWRENVSSLEINWRDELRCHVVFQRSCHLRFCFCSQEGRQYASWLQWGETRAPCEDHCSLAGQFWAPRLMVHVLDCSCWHANTWSGPRSLRLLCACSIMVTDAQSCKLGGKGAELRMPVCCFLLGAINGFTCIDPVSESEAREAHRWLNTPPGRSWLTQLWNIYSSAVLCLAGGLAEALICLYYPLPSSNLIWLDVLYQAKGSAQISARNITSSLSWCCLLIEPSEMEWSCHRLRSAAGWRRSTNRPHLFGHHLEGTHACSGHHWSSLLDVLRPRHSFSVQLPSVFSSYGVKT